MAEVAIVRAESYERVAWKNGGGVTHVVATAPGPHPAWRISMAHIERDGPFSDFGGYDRTIVALSGDGVTLVFATGQARLLATFVPFAFRGEDDVEARLTGGPATDLNVMTLRATHRHDVAAIGIGENGVPVQAGDVCGFLYVASGAIAIDGDGAATGDTIALGAGVRTVAAAVGGPATAIAIRIFAR